MGSCPPDSKCFLLPHPTCWSQADSMHTSLPRPWGSTATISIGSTTLIKPTLSPLPGQLGTRFQPNQGRGRRQERPRGGPHRDTGDEVATLGNCKRETQRVMTKSGPGQGQNGEGLGPVPLSRAQSKGVSHGAEALGPVATQVFFPVSWVGSGTDWSCG